jgi:hypothetical protein
MIKGMNKNQIIGLLMAVLGIIVGLLWEKPVEYAEIIEFLFGVFSAIGISMILKFLPIKSKNKINS